MPAIWPFELFELCKSAVVYGSQVKNPESVPLLLQYLYAMICYGLLSLLRNIA